MHEQRTMYETSRLNTERRALHSIPEAQAAIAREAGATLQRVKDCARMAPSQRRMFIEQLETMIPRASDPDTAAKLDALDTQIRRVLRHLT